MTAHNEWDEGPDAPPATPAATLVIFRRSPTAGTPQILMVERSASLAFAGGAAVFPGGKVDEADRDLARALGAADGDDALDEIAARITAVRETLEETGLAVGLSANVTLDQARDARAMLLEQGALAPVLERMGWSLALDRLVPFSRWRPRHRHMRVFDTRFYLADLGTGAVDLLVDATENTHLFWASAAEALDLADTSKIKIIFPTRRNLERLAQFGSFDEAVAHVEEFPSRMISPFIETREGDSWLCIPADAGYPVTGEKLDSAARG